MIAVYDFSQDDEEWSAARCGIPTASNFGKILTTKGARSKQRQDYLYKLAGEAVSKRTDASYYNDAMRRGHEIEPLARSFAEMKLGAEILTPGIVYPDERKLYACSPDGLLSGKNEGLEIKSPELTAAVKYLDKGTVPTTYVPQVQGSLMITGFERWWFLSYAPGLKPLLIPVGRNENLIRLYREAVEEFCAELAALINRIS